MNRREFLQKVSIAAASLAVVPALPLLTKNPYEDIADSHSISIHPVELPHRCPYGKIRSWEPNTHYNVGDRVRFSNGKVVELQMSGTSCGVESMNGTILPLKGDW